MNEFPIRDSVESVSREYLETFMYDFGFFLQQRHYVDFMLVNNGGYVRGYILDANREPIFQVESLYPFKNPLGKITIEESIIEFIHCKPSVLPRGYFPIGDDAGGEIYCISCLKETYGKLFIFRCSEGIEEPVFVADDFSSFLDKIEFLD